MFDRITAGAVGGFVAGIIMGALSFTLFNLNICELCIIAMGGGAFTGRLMKEITITSMLLSWTVHFAISIGYGVILSIMLTYFGTKLYLLKGLVFMVIAFFVVIGIIAPLRGLVTPTAEYFDLLLILSYHGLYGLVASYLIVRYGDLRVVR